VPFIGGDVRTALEQIRWQPGRHDGRRVREWSRRQRESRCGLPGQHGNGMFEQRALHAQIGSLSAGGLQLGLSLSYVYLGRNSSAIAILCQLQGFLIGRNRGV
jgi:hypothetical protein